MEAVIDSGGRVVLPKHLRDALGLTPGTTVDISPYGTGVQVTPGGRTARLEREADGCLVSRGDAAVTDDMMYALIDSVRR
jgi:AbrB family looped-hinge helix DNA binding protein